jgi:hypothetical protein
MKKTLLFLILATFYTNAFSQDPEFEYYRSREIKTILGHDNESGGYAAFYGGNSVIDHNQAIVFGARFSWLAGHSMGTGIGITGFINEYHYEPALDRNVFLAGGYGGIVIEPIVMPRMPIHFSFPVLIGGGGISYISRDDNYNDNIIEDSKAFLLMEPGAEIELNVTRFFRLAAGFTYRFPASFDLVKTTDNMPAIRSIRGMTGIVTLKVGKF